jgi:hypothetical protein
MRKWFKDWTPLPADMLIQVLLPVIFIVVGVLASILFPLLQRLRRADAWTLFGVAVAAGVVGAALLFLARLPLYRRRQFFTVGPHSLDAPHRRLYWLAYSFVGASVLLLLSLLAVLRS